MLDHFFFAVVLIKYLGTNNNSRDHSNLIKRFSYRALKGMWSMLWRIEAAGRNQEDVVLFSCQIINTGQTGRGWSSWTARHIICQSLLCTSETLLKLLHCTCKCSLTAAVDFFSPTLQIIHSSCGWAPTIIPPLKSFLVLMGERCDQRWASTKDCCSKFKDLNPKLPLVMFKLCFSFTL